MATRYVQSLETFLFKVQAAEDTAEGALVGSDLIEVLRGASIERNLEGSDVDVIGGKFDQEAWVPGKDSASATLTCPLRNMGTGVQPDYFNVMQVCGFDISEHNGYYRATPNSTNTKAGTLWCYRGAQGTTNLEKLSKLKGTWKISAEASQVASIEFSLSGSYDSYGNGTVPSITRNRFSPPALINATVQFAGISFNLVSFEVDAGQEVDTDTDATSANGVGLANITDRKMKWSAKVYMDAQSTQDPHAALAAGTEGPLQVWWGSATPEIRIYGDYAQITDVKTSEQNGVTTFDLSGQLNRNDFWLDVLGGGSSSSSSSSS